jgi:5'-deoxynucleotidase
MEYHFFAMMSRMKYIERWALMRNSIGENISEHSLEVSMIAHVLAVIGNKRFHKSLNAEKAALIAIYHDATEIITGDMPTPIKYYNRDIIDAFKKIEENAADQLLSMLPQDLREEYESIFFVREEDAYLWKLVKAADKLSALIKCIEEGKAGNTEFTSARISIEETLHKLGIPEADEFMKEFLPSYQKTLDELQ